VSWSAPAKSIAGESGPIVTGYNVYRTAPGGELGELPTPINTAPVKGTTYTDAPAYGEHEYRVAAVATTGPPAIQSDLSAPARVAFRDLVPPPTPAGLTVLIETKVVRLLWEPVSAPDLAGYNVYRTEGKWRLKLTPTPTKDPNFLDISIDIGIFYTYEVTAVDASGNESAPTPKSEPVTVPKTP
jgi:fibronectin type 3 domain-containing protein